MYCHYIRKDEENNIIKVFSTAFEEPEAGDILYVENTQERHFNMDLTDKKGVYLYKWSNDEIVEKTGSDFDSDLSIYKYAKKQFIKSQAQSEIMSEYPLFKQININNLQSYTEQNKTDMWTFINDKRTQSDTMEADIDALATKEAIEDYTVTFT